ncbi:MAG: polysaccharide biosynthesis protein [Planctomycetes bacterium]|nr:polysaccharide biosynthesis protein [Planctomycetota bacterium]
MPHAPLPGFLTRYRMPLVVLAHALLVAAALLAAFCLAYNFRWNVEVAGGGRQAWFAELYLPLLALALPIKLLVFQRGGQYRGSWRYVGLRDLFDVISASLVGTFLFLTAYFLLENGWSGAFGRPLIAAPPGPSLRQSAVFAIDWAATIVFVSAARVLVRFYYEELHPQRSGSLKTPVLIVGAGNTGEGVLRELLRMGREQYDCVGFLDDAVAQLHGRIHGVEVVGRTADIRRLCLELGVREVLIALPHATPKFIRELVERCEGTGVLFRTIPAVADVIEGRVQVSQIREVDIADLLGRDPVQLDSDIIGTQLRGRVVLVTGAGGSIGSEMCRQIAGFAPRQLVLVERGENNLFEIDRELRAVRPSINVLPLVADITDGERLKTIFDQTHPAIVFHAAAHKHVPMMELNPGEAIKNNIVGTLAVADACLSWGVERMVMISTDKAVNPTSIMGCTKRVAEMYVQGLTHRGPTQFITVRFGNVLGSSGSVVPIFRQQILRGGPVTVTHPEMVRFFMTISEAAQLVLQAGAMGRGGEIYVLHMGDPVRIVDLARDMITLSGLRPGVDIEIVFTGKRRGEKLYEELLIQGEHIGDTAHPKIRIWKHRSHDFESVCRGIEELRALADGGGEEEIRAGLRRLVPEYTPEVPEERASSRIPPTVLSAERE